MSDRLSKKSYLVFSMRFVLTGILKIFVGELAHLDNLNLDYRKLYDCWNSYSGDKEKTFSDLVEIVYNDIFICRALNFAWNSRNRVDNPRPKEELPKDALKFDIDVSSDAIDFIYNIRYATIMTRSQYDKLLVLIFSHLGKNPQGNGFRNKINYIKGNLKAEEKIPGISKILDKLLPRVEELKKFRDPISHKHEIKFDIFNTDDTTSVLNFKEYFEKINEEVNQFHLILIEYIKLVTGKKFRELKIKDPKVYLKNK